MSHGSVLETCIKNNIAGISAMIFGTPDMKLIIKVKEAFEMIAKCTHKNQEDPGISRKSFTKET